jgi:hypothetical protein
MGSKVYLEWRAKLGKWVVEYPAQVQAQFETKAQGHQWMQANFPNLGKERERVQKRKNSLVARKWPAGCRRPSSPILPSSSSTNVR